MCGSFTCCSEQNLQVVLAGNLETDFVSDLELDSRLERVVADNE